MGYWRQICNRHGMAKRTRDEAAGEEWRRERPELLRNLGSVACCMGIDEAGR